MKEVRPPWLAGPKKYWRTSELHDQGLSSRQIARLVVTGMLIRMRKGCYRTSSDDGAQPTTGVGKKTPNGDGAQTPVPAGRKTLAAEAAHRMHAHQYSVGNGVGGTLTYSHTTAARLFGLSLWKADGLVHLTQPSPVTTNGHGPDVRIHQGRLPASQILYRNGFRYTSLERTVIDCARILSYEQALIIADHALRKGAKVAVMQDIVEALARHKGIANARRIVIDANGLSESPGETLTRHFFVSLGLPMPELQVVVDTRFGRHRLDFALREILLAIEFDGRNKYFDYAPTDEVIFQERRREKALMELGWEFVRIEWDDLFREQLLKQRILEAIDHAKRRRR